MISDKDIRAVADFMTLMFRFIQEQQKATTDQALQMSALLQAVFEKHPEISESYHRYLNSYRQTSPLAQTTAAIVEELEQHLAQVEKAAQQTQKD